MTRIGQGEERAERAEERLREARSRVSWLFEWPDTELIPGLTTHTFAGEFLRAVPCEDDGVELKREDGSRATEREDA